MYKTESESIDINIIPTYESSAATSKSLPNNIHMISSEQARAQLKKLRQNKEMYANELNGDEDNSMHLFDDEDDFEDKFKLDELTSQEDLVELFIKLIFEPYRFSKQNIVKSLGVGYCFFFTDKYIIVRLKILKFCKILGQHVLSDDAQIKTLVELKEMVTKSIERAVQTHPSYNNCTDEEFLGLNAKYWTKYYTMLKQYDYDSRLPLGFFVDPNNESIILLIRKVKKYFFL
jgi:hypothetical protein